MRRRSRSSGWFQKAVSSVRTLVSGRDESPVGRRKGQSGNTAIVGIVLGCVGVGYLLGNAFPWTAAASEGGLRADAGTGGTPGANRGIAPGPIGEQEDLRPLAESWFFTSVYDDLASARAAATWLRDHELPTARPREFPLNGKLTYSLVVYFDGPSQRDQFRQQLLAVEPSDEQFASFRLGTPNWPIVQGREASRPR
ncbi:MAG: hypothetical protein AB7O97_00860 [Planctomycetota bacterium]